MNKSKKLIIAVLLLIVGLLGFYFSLMAYKSAYKNAPEEKIKVSLTKDEREREKVEKYNQYISAIEDFRNCESDSDCVRIPDGQCNCGNMGNGTAINKNYLEESKKIHDQVYPFIGCMATMSQNISCYSPPICEDLKCTIDVQNPQVCERSDRPDSCYYFFARTKKNIEICEYLGEGKDIFTREDCIIALAFDLRDSSLCNKVIGEAEIRCRKSVDSLINRN